jgi:hypothetical protein
MSGKFVSFIASCTLCKGFFFFFNFGVEVGVGESIENAPLGTSP